MELYRIVTMLLIVCSHWGCGTELIQLAHAHQGEASSYFYYFLNMWGKTGINCFLMITGYYMCKSRITLRKFLKMYLQVVFWSLAISCIFELTNYHHFSLKDWILMLIPFRMVETDSFVQAFMVWWLFIPFLNILLNGMDRKAHLRLLGLIVAVFTGLYFLPDSFSFISVNPICWYSTIYLVAAYIRKYPGHVWRVSSASSWGWVTLACVAFSVASVFAIVAFSNRTGCFVSPSRLVVDSMAPMALAIAVSSFLFFKNWNIGHSTFINAVGATTFGILLIHSNSGVMRQWLWQDVFHCVENYDTPFYWLRALGGVGVVYIICSILEVIRIRTVERWTMAWLDSRLSKRNR